MTFVDALDEHDSNVKNAGMAWELVEKPMGGLTEFRQAIVVVLLVLASLDLI